MITKNVPCDQQKRKKPLAMEMSWLFIFMAEVLPIQWFNSHTHLCSVTQGVQTSFLSLSWERAGALFWGVFSLLFLFFSLFLTERTLKYSCGESVLVCVASLSLVTLWEVMLCQRQRWKNALHFSGLCLMKVEWFSSTPVKKTTTKY